MSFCTDVKNELAGLRPSKSSLPPLVYGFLLFSRSFSFRRISMQTANPVMAETYARLLYECYGAGVTVREGGGSRPTYCAQVDSEADRLKILAAYDFGIAPGAIDRELLPDDASAAAFIRGAFFACGNLSDPEQEYRADFSVRQETLAAEFLALLSDHFITARISRRGTGFVVYLRQSEMIINLLTLMGASDRSLELLGTTVVKSMKNKTNRARNCDSANISKTVEASIAQRTAIEYLEQTERLESLPPELYAAAVLRRDNPEATLHELCRISPEPITVSGLNHRLRRIMEIYFNAEGKMQNTKPGAGKSKT